MKKMMIVLAMMLGSQLFAQEAPLQGVELTQIEKGVKDFTITDDFQAYTLHQSLIDECISYTIIDEETLSKEDLFGVFFHFENQTVLYILCRGGTVKGSLIEKV
jgi:hypothetical protein